jgi:cytochrome c-type biogenesis protein CcmE
VSPNDDHTDDQASADEHGDDLDLRPRTSTAVIHGRRPGGASARKWPWLVVLGVIVVGIGFVITHAITDATLYYLNADEAVARQTELGSKHFRLQGSVVEGSVQKEANGTAFKVAYHGVEVPVFATGDPPQLFQECIPVVLDGQWTGTGSNATFTSGQIIVAHDSTYEAENSQRLKEAEDAAKQNGGETRGACLVEQMERSAS